MSTRRTFLKSAAALAGIAFFPRTPKAPVEDIPLKTAGGVDIINRCEHPLLGIPGVKESIDFIPDRLCWQHRVSWTRKDGLKFDCVMRIDEGWEDGINAKDLKQLRDNAMHAMTRVEVQERRLARRLAGARQRLQKRILA